MIYRSSHVSTPYQSLINHRARLQSISRTQPWGQRISSVRTGSERLQTHRHSPPSTYQPLLQRQPYTPLYSTPRTFTLLEPTLRPPLAKTQAQSRPMLQKPALQPIRTSTYTRYEVGSKSILAHLHPSKTFTATHPALQKTPLSLIDTQQRAMKSISPQTSRGVIQQKPIPPATVPYASLTKASMGKVFSRFEPSAYLTATATASVKTPISTTITSSANSAKEMLSLYDLVTPTTPVEPQTSQSPAVLPSTAEKIEDTPKIDSLSPVRSENSAIAKEDNIKQENTKHIGSAVGNLNYRTEYKLAVKSVRSGITIPNLKIPRPFSALPAIAEKVVTPAKAGIPKTDSHPPARLKSSAIAKKEDKTKQKSTKQEDTATSNLSYTTEYKLAVKSVKARIAIPRLNKTSQSPTTLPFRAEKADSHPPVKSENNAITKENSIKHRSTKHVGSAVINPSYTSKYKLALKSEKSGITVPRPNTQKSSAIMPSTAEKSQAVSKSKIDSPPPAKLENSSIAKKDNIKQESTKHIDSAARNLDRASEYKLALKSGRVVITMPRLKPSQSLTTTPSTAEKVEAVSTSKVDSPPPAKLENSATAKEDIIKQESTNHIDSAASNSNRDSEYKLVLKSGRVVITMPSLKTRRSSTILPSTAEKVEVVSTSRVDSHPSTSLANGAIAKEDSVKKESTKHINSAASNLNRDSEYKQELKSGRIGVAIPSFAKETKIKFNEEVRIKIIHPSEYKPAVYSLDEKPIQGKKSAKGILVTQRTAKEIQREKSFESKLQTDIQVKFNREEREFRRERALALMGLK